MRFRLSLDGQLPELSGFGAGFRLSRGSQAPEFLCFRQRGHLALADGGFEAVDRVARNLFEITVRIAVEGFLPDHCFALACRGIL